MYVLRILRLGFRTLPTVLMDEQNTILWIALVMSFITTTSTTMTVTAYDGTGIVQQQPLTLGCNYTKGDTDNNNEFNWKHKDVVIVSGTVNTQTASFQTNTEWESGVFLGDFTSSLTIQLPASNVTPSVAGQYTCRVLSLTGGVQDTVTATVQYTPKINSTFPSSRNVTEFSGLQIDCSSYTSPGNPPTTSYTWTYGGFTVSSGAVLDMNNITKDRRGQYTCRANNTVGSDSETVSVDVQYAPKINSTFPTSRTVTELSRLQIDCSSYTTPGNPATTSYTWTYGGSTVSSGAVLDMNNITRDRRGQYTCTASNTVGSDSETVSVDVQYFPKINSTFPSSRNVTEFSRLQIDCSNYTTPGNPATTSYTWTDVGSFFSSGAVLDINNIGRDKRGQFTCTANNTVGSDSETVSVDVQYGPGNSVQVTPEGTTALVEGSGPFTAKCAADCNPNCSISWRSDTRTLNSVSISNVSQTDQGNYTCQAQNGIGGPQEKTIILVVYYLDRPDLLLGLTEVEENETVSLTCNVESNPTAELEIRNVDNDTVLVERGTNSLQFTIDRVQCLHNGSVLCTAGNTQTRSMSNSTLREINVKCSPRQDFRHKLNNIVANHISETAALIADVIANPVPEFRWFRQETEGLTNISRDTIHSISNSRLQSVLYINISRTQDYGDYVLEMENSQGKSQLLFTLTSKVPPSSPINFKVVGTSHDTVSLSWKSNFNGGSPQTFTLQYHDAEKKDWKLGNNGIPDPGKYETITENITGLEANTMYYFAVFGTNEFGDGSSIFINRTTETLPKQLGGTGLDIIPIVSGIVAALVVIAIVAVMCILYRRGTFTSLGNKTQDRILNQSDRVEMEDNILYASSGPDRRDEAVMQENDLYCGTGDVHRGATASQGNDVCAKPIKKTKSADNKAVNEADIYATPNMKKPKVDDKKDANDGGDNKKKGKGKGRSGNQKNGAKNRQNRGDVYENAEQFGATAAADSVYANTGVANEGFQGDESTGNTKETPKTGRDEEGLMYVGIDFGNQRPGKVIIRTEPSTEYASVAYGRVGDPLPDDDEDTKS